MPETAARPSLRIVPDLLIEVGDSRSATSARLTAHPGDHHTLVLDVDDPVVFARCLPTREVRRDLRLPTPRGVTGAPLIRLTSRGRDLGRVRVTPSGRLRYRPASGALLVGAHLAVADHQKALARIAAAGATLSALLLLWRRWRPAR